MTERLSALDNISYITEKILPHLPFEQHGLAKSTAEEVILQYGEREDALLVLIEGARKKVFDKIADRMIDGAADPNQTLDDCIQYLRKN